jgi:hydroxymethylpyrimidine/phosphomethylpyrimidine kinase
VRPIVLSIAGFDPSAGAGVQGDLKAIEANGGYAATVVTAITVQNTREVQRIVPVEADLVSEQLEAIFGDLRVRAVKTGVVPTVETVGAVVDALQRYAPSTYIMDPVFRSSQGRELQSAKATERSVRDLLPLSTLITPNAAEAEQLTGIRVRDVDEAAAAGEVLLDLGADAALVTGGHLERQAGTDVLVTPRGVTEIEGAWVDCPHTHGTGCAYSAAIATRLAVGSELEPAVREAKRFITNAIRHGLPIGLGPGPTDPLFGLHQLPGDGSVS